MVGSGAVVERARQLAAAGYWHAVRDLLAGADSPDNPDSPDGRDLAVLELRRDAAWWLGDGVESMTLAEEVYQLFEAEGEWERAARQALDLGAQWASRGDIVVAGGWLGRARRHLADLPPTPTHALLRYVEASLEMDLYGDPEPARATAADLDALARDHGDPGLRGFARVLDGLAAVRSGEVQRGFEALDEAMLDVIAGHVPPMWAGDIYCTVIHLSHELGDWARMRAWTQSLDRWAGALSRTFMYAAVTRVHQLELAGAQGEWDRVEQRMAGTSEDLVGSHGWLAGAGYHELGEVRRLTGDLAGAAQAFARARALGTDPQPGEAMLACVTGRPADAVAALRLALSGRGVLQRARLLLPTVEAALAAGDQELARACAAELATTASRYGTPELRASAGHATALVALADSDPDAALAPLQEALTVYRDQGLQYATARAHEALARALDGLGDHTGADAEQATALAAYRRLGATPDVERLTPATRPGGLTAREEEILACVAAGASNREVAQRLVISEKTVSRHLANVFAKLGVGSRTAAAAWAHERGIHETPHATR